MRYKLLGRSGLRVSELCLGTMTFGEDWGWGASKEDSRSIFDAYVEAGGNFIDTAVNYTDGTSESYVGEFIAPDRDRFVVATKYSISTRPDDLNAGGNHRKNMVRSVETSLKRLGTDHIDLYWVHLWDSTTPVEEVMRGLDDLVRAGKVLYVGISDAPAWIVSQANTLAELRGWSRFVALQIRYSLARREAERDLLPMARAFDLAVTPWAVLGGGVLTGKYAQEGDDPRRYRRAKAEEVTVGEAVVSLAEEIGRTPSQVAINWVRARQDHALLIPILGARNEAQLRDNLGCLDFELTPEQMQRLDDASPIDLGFPHAFLGNERIRRLVFGDKLDLLDNPHT